MTEIYDEFIVYDLQNTGDRTRLNIKPEELQNHLNPEHHLSSRCSEICSQDAVRFHDDVRPQKTRNSFNFEY